MDNVYPPAGDGDPQDSRRTDQFWTSRPGPAGHPQDPAGPPPQPSYLEQHYTRDRRHALRWTVGLSLALVLAAGGVIAGVALASHPPNSSFSQASDSTAAHSATNSSATNSSANSSGSGSVAAGQPQSQAAALSSVLNAAGTSGTLTLSSAPAATGGTAKAVTKAAAAARVAACRRAVATLRAARRTGRLALIRAARADVIAHCHGLRRRLSRFVLLRGVEGQFTFRTKQGTFRTLAFERGVIQSVSSSAIVVRTVNGRTETWQLVSNTVVREHGQKTSTHALTSGEPVWVGGPVISGANDARLIVIRPPSAPNAATPAPSASGS